MTTVFVRKKPNDANKSEQVKATVHTQKATYWCHIVSNDLLWIFEIVYDCDSECDKRQRIAGLTKNKNESFA